MADLLSTRVRFTKKLLKSAGILGILASYCCGGSANAVTASWNANTANWNSSNSWQGGIIPNGEDDAAIFDNDIIGGNKTATLPGTGIVLGELRVQGSNAVSTTVLIQTGTLFFQSSSGSSLLEYKGTNKVTINSAIDLANGLVIRAAADPSAASFQSTLAIGGIIRANGHNIEVNAGYALAATTISGAITDGTGSGSKLLKTGGGTLTLSGANNTFSGGLEITAGKLTTTLANANGGGTVVGATASGANNLGSGNILVANVDGSLEINAGSNANKHVTFAGGTVTLENGGTFSLIETATTNNFQARFNAGTISGGGYASRGTLVLSGADFVYNADGTGGTEFTNSATLVFNTSQNTTAMSVTLNNTTLLGRLGAVSKTGNNNLVFTAGDMGTFRADSLSILSGLGSVSFNQTYLDLSSGLILSGANTTFTSLLAVTGLVGFGIDNQLSGNAALTIEANAIANLQLNGTSQTFSTINIADGARLGLWLDKAAPATLNLGTVITVAGVASSSGINYLSIYNWVGNPDGYADIGTSVAGNTVVGTDSTDLSKVWFRGYAPGAVRDADGTLRPVGFLDTTLTASGNWFDFANWSVDVPDRAGTTVNLSAVSSALQGKMVTIGHVVAVGSPTTISTTAGGLLIFDSGVAGTHSTISGSGGVIFTAPVQVKNALDISATGFAKDGYLWNYGRGGSYYQSVRFDGGISGSGDINVYSNAYIGGTNMSYSGNVNIFSGGRLDLSNENALGGATGSVISMYGGILGGFVASPGTVNNYVRIPNKIAMMGDFGLSVAFLDYDGDVDLNGNRTLYFWEIYNRATYNAFGENFNIRGDYSLTLKYGANMSYAAYLDIRGGNNTFSGGFNLESSLNVAVAQHSNLITGELSEGNNYIGSGDITLKGGSLTLKSAGYDVDMRGNLTSSAAVTIKDAGDVIMSGTHTQTGNKLDISLSGDFLMSGSLSVSGTNGALSVTGGSSTITGSITVGNGNAVYFYSNPAVFDSAATWTTPSGTSSIYTDSNLTFNASIGGAGTINLYTRPASGTVNSINSSLVGGIGSLNGFVKEGLGTTSLNTRINANSVTVSAGTLLLNGNDLVRPRAGTTPPALTIAGGLLQTSGGLSGDPNINTFGNLSVTSSSGIYLQDNSYLIFSGIGTWAMTGTIGQLNLANSTGIWSTSSDPVASNTYIIFKSNAGFSGTNAGRLDLVAFTGYEQGAMLVWSDSLGGWFLAPTGSPLSEWLGAGTGATDTDRLWSNAANWTGGQTPNLAGSVAAIRDLDGRLDGNAIIVDQDFIIGKLNIESAGGQTFDIMSRNGGLLIFDNNDANAVLNNQGGHLSTLSADLRLDSTLKINQSSANKLTLSSDISGEGGIIFDTPRDSTANRGVLVLGTTNADGISTSDYTGGFRLVGSTATSASLSGSREIQIAANGTLFGAGKLVGDGADAAFNTQALTIGDGTAGRWYFIRPDVDGANRTVDASIRIAGNICFSQFGNYSGIPQSTLTFQSTAPSYVEAGMWQIYGAASFASPILNLKTDLQGPGGFYLPSSARVNFYGNNTFTGGLKLASNGAGVGVGGDTALGAGLVEFVGSTKLYALNGGRTVSNELLVNTSGGISFIGNFTLNHQGTSVLNQNFYVGMGNGGNVLTVAEGHVLTGSGGIYQLESADTLRLLGANTYTGDTKIGRSALVVGNDNALGTGTLYLGASTHEDVTLSTYGGPITLANAVVFALAGTSNTRISLNASAGDLTLSANYESQLRSGRVTALNVTGVVNFGKEFSLVGEGSLGLAKVGAGTLTLASGSSNYAGNTSISAGTIRINASGDVTFGREDAGNNYLGLGKVILTGGLLEIVTANGNTVRYGGDTLSITNATIRVTDTIGSSTGTDTKTYFDSNSDQTITGSGGAFRVSGDLVKSMSSTLSWSNVGITTGRDFIVQAGNFNWNSGSLVTQHLRLQGGTTTLGSSLTQSGVAQLTLGNARLNTSGFNHTFANALLNLDGSAIIDMEGQGLFTFAGIGNTWTGSLDILNWAGDSIYGGGATQIRFINNVLTALDYAKLSNITFSGVNGVEYSPGARLLYNPQKYYELLPVSVSSIWNGGATGNNWGSIGNWVGNSVPNGIGAAATFADTLQLNGEPVNIDISGLTLGSIIFKNNTGATYTIGGANDISFQMQDEASAAIIRLENDNSVAVANTGGLILKNHLVVNTTGTGSLTIATRITGNKSIIKTGNGVLALNTSTSNYSGGLTLLEGTLNTNASTTGPLGGVTNGPFGTGAITVAGDLNPTLVFTAIGPQTINNAINFDTAMDGTPAQVKLTVNTVAGNTATLGAAITQLGDGVGGLAKDGDGILTLGGLVDLAGELEVNRGTLILSTANTFGGGANINGGIVEIQNNDALGNRTVNFAAGTTLRAGANDLVYSNNTKLGGTVYINTNGNTTKLTSVLSGSGMLNKIGTGTLILDDANGTNAIAATEGNIQIANAGALKGQLTVGSGAYAFGVGSYGGDIVVRDGGTLSVAADIIGDAIGTLNTAGNITLESGSNLIFNLGNGSGDNYSQVVLSGGAVAANNATLTLLDNGSSTYTAERFDLFINSVSGASLTFTANGALLVAGDESKTVVLGDREYWLSDENTTVSLVALTTIPEPSTYGLIGVAGLLSLMVIRRRRDKR
ncbi:MAG: autotransporter-associated beta strand repeat-containing protein [Puniceicoccales bacterium]|jgi:autotransporter-associated beta strand protein|nr:autotransporter-associated beta strand repeat-containing protein [Puniceicoccales bacterium]